MKKTMIALLLITAILSATPANAESKFTDVDATKYAWATGSIDFMVASGVVKGYPDGTFKPDKPVTKAEFAHMYHLLFPSVDNGSDKALKFNDAKKHWAALDIAALFNGDDSWLFADYDGNILPDKQLTRWDVAMLTAFLTTQLNASVDAAGNYITCDEIFSTISSTFKDVPVKRMTKNDSLEDSLNFYAPVIFYDDNFDGTLIYDGDGAQLKAEAIYSIIKANVMAGADGYFRPKAKVTRAEAVTILNRVNTILQGGENR
ncbi:S-layer homology domain-containing protein [Paenibacillus lignilyticus]|uniref:S-layer homology domain-containing protein n=1 Tax=Paenibacillus lignilyticus TaxID=1172615 RepID=A0ABS5CK29_9BACL|nr:S-layer homology domain-containing protein [Paenibacillus lignilyticus]MBP3966230.1 S-layer homology domain-containing protein [Paenibacillus lignilyticus]